MQKKILCLSALIISLFLTTTYAQTPVTERIPQLDNSRVAVWQTIVYPTHMQQLKMHRHEHDHVVVALTDGTLKITNNDGQTHLLKLVKDHAYFLLADSKTLFHTDENIGQLPIRVMVIDLK